jgi:predicted ABC-type ATPase
MILNMIEGKPLPVYGTGKTSSFESVFSHPSKIDEIEAAKKAGYKTYLYFIATSDPLINLQRVRSRVESGGHDVPEVKIRGRYTRTLQNCYKAFLASGKVFFFDNSDNIVNNAYDFFAEKAEGKLYVSKSDVAPEWFNKYILQKISR